MARILVIEDEPLSRRLMVTCLKNVGHDVVEAENGSRGIERLGREAFDLVVTDIFMPVGDGLEVVRHVRIARPDIPVMVVSAGSDLNGDDFLPAARALGAAATLDKPFAPGDFLSVVNRLLPA
ncbi:response regulator transcription factor [Arenibaculum pallidiluteum]|uniref:response regulator transcription factor n=1 Tax=Arenibaculum pallidiluteum TaxID=2812559 RepID=UPI001A9714F8|nr:response regulator [Arenibaculum pallidiluteum]